MSSLTVAQIGATDLKYIFTAALVPFSALMAQADFHHGGPSTHNNMITSQY